MYHALANAIRELILILVSVLNLIRNRVTANERSVVIMDGARRFELVLRSGTVTGRPRHASRFH